MIHDAFDRAYFARRAQQEAELATRATHPAAVAAHYRLSTAYLELAYPSTGGLAKHGGRAGQLRVVPNDG